MGVLSSLMEYNYDIDNTEGKYTEEKKTGIEGVKQMLRHDAYGCPSPQMALMSEAVAVTTFTGIVIGGFTYYLEAYARFIRNNKATAFENPYLAKRIAYDKAMIGFFKGAWMWGWRICLFSSSVFFLTTAIPAYRGKHSVFDLTAGTGLSGMVYKLKAGPKQMIAGGLFGAFLGTMGGCAVAGVSTLLGVTMDDIYNYKEKSMRGSGKDRKFEVILKQRAEEEKEESTSTEEALNG